MKDIQQLIKKSNEVGRYDNVFPKTFIDAIKDRETGVSLRDILSSFNMYFLTYIGSPEDTRLQLPRSLRRMGVWITYVTWDNTVHIEWYSSDDISDETFRSSLYWKEGTNSLVGDLSISAEGNWVINGEDTGIPARGEKGITPVLRLGKNNRFQVSYNEGGSYSDITSEPIITQLRVYNNKLQKSLDLGKIWEDESDYISSYFREKDNKIQISKDKETWEDISDNIAAWFRWQENDDNLGRIQISRDNNTWENFSPEFINRMLIKGFVTSLPQNAEYGDIYMVGPYYNQEDSEHVNPYYRMWVMQDTWVDAGYYNKNTYNFNYNIKKTYPSVSAMDADKSNPIGTNGLVIQIGDIVTVVNSTTPSENGYYSYEGSENGWLLQSGFSFEIVQITGTDINKTMSQKAVTDELGAKANHGYNSSPKTLKEVEDNVNDKLIKGWVIAEAMAISNPTYSADGNISDAVITWGDGDVGSISDVVVGQYGIISIRYNRSDGGYATMSITYDSKGEFEKQEVIITKI